MAPYIGYDAETSFIPGTLNTSSSLTVQGGGITQTGGDVNFDSSTFYVDSVNNRVGIGTISPSYLLHISSATDASLCIEEPGSNTVRLKAGTSASFIGTISNHPFYFTTNNTERARIDSSGGFQFKGAGTAGVTQAVSFNGSAPVNSLVITSGGLVGLGTSSPSSNLDVRGVSGTTIIRAAGADTNGNADVEIFSTGTTGNSRLYFSDTAAQSGSIIYTHSANSLSFTTNATTAVTIDSSQRVGIGTTGPTANLDIVGTGNLELRLRAASDAALIFSETAANKNWKIKPSAGDFYFQYSATAYNSGYSSLLTIKNTGNVGIGTTTPTNALLHVSSSIAAGAIKSEDTGSTGSFLRILGDASSGNLINWKTGTNLRFATSDDNYGSFSERARIDSSGRLGIGTTGPQGKLVISNSGAEGLEIYPAYSSGLNMQFHYNRSGAVFVDSQSRAATHQFYINNTESARIDSSGRVGIGTTSNRNSTKLDVLGDITFGENANYYGTLGYNAGTGHLEYTSSDGAFKWIRRSGPATSMVLDSSGRLLVNTTTSALDNIGGTGYANIVQILGAATGAGLKVGNTADFARINVVRSASVGTDVELGTISFGAEVTSVERARVSCFSETTGGSGGRGGNLRFYTAADASATPTERMRITQQGFAKHSSTNSYAGATGTYHEFRSGEAGDAIMLFHNTAASVTGTIGGVVVKYTASSPNDTSKYLLYCEDSTALRAGFRSNGGLANYSANNANLSDRNAKKDISLAADTWSCVKEWEIVNYRYKDQPEDADLNLGVIAQQVAESCPEVITVFQEAKEATETEPAKEERLGVKEQQMYWMAIKALQEAMERIEALEADVAALKGA